MGHQVDKLSILGQYSTSYLGVTRMASLLLWTSSTQATKGVFAEQLVPTIILRGPQTPSYAQRRGKCGWFASRTPKILLVLPIKLGLSASPTPGDIVFG